ncbi:MAG: flagellin, partial [Nitriliruptor sp.]
QIGGLKVATRNAQDAISLVQTAEGAQTEVHTILQRMRDLVVQSGNLGTNDNEALKANQSEIAQLSEELDRIADQTQFGTKKILDGSFAQTVAQAAVTLTGGNTEVPGDGTTGAASLVYDLGAATGFVANRDATYTLTFNDGTNPTSTIEVSANTGADATEAATNLSAALGDAAVPTGFTVSVTGDTVSIEGPTTAGAAVTLDAAVLDEVLGGGANFQVGANANQTVNVFIDSVEASSLGTAATGVTTGGSLGISAANGVGGVKVYDADTSTSATEEDIANALLILDQSIGDVSANRATLGAFQNRMESTIRNVSVATENLQAAESRIRDVDMAAEMVDFTRHQIMQQAGTAMLAQANQVPQSVLSLLR